MDYQTFRGKPFAVVPASALFELTIAADNGAPTAADGSVANVIFAPTTGINATENRFGPREVMVKARFTGAGAAGAAVTAVLWQFDEDSGQWYGSNMVPLRGVDALAVTGGSMAKVDVDPNTRRAYIEIDGLDGDEDAVLVVTKVR